MKNESIKIENNENALTWVRPDLDKEKGEIERVLTEFLSKDSTEENVEKIVGLVRSAPIVELSDEEWELLQNTDSFHNVRPGHLVEDAEEIAEQYNKDLSFKRNFKSIVDGFTNGGSMEVPIIIKNKQGVLHLISGNTRLMVARALGIRPKVVIVELS